MGLTDDYSGQGGLLGIGMTPRPAGIHQFIIGNMVTKLNIMLRKSKYYALPEYAVYREGKHDRAPDVTILLNSSPEPFNNPEKFIPIIVIEICDTRTVNRTEKLLIELMSKVKIKEAFIYDYQKNSFIHYYTNKRDTNSQSAIFPDIDLKEFIKPL